MNSKKRIIGKNVLLAVMAILLIIAIVAVISGGDWRPVWDKCLQWINFLLLFTAIYWWGWPFFMKMLDGRINGISDEIGNFEKEKANIEIEIKSIEDGLAQSEVRFAQIKAKMETEIAQKREQIIIHAKNEAASIIEQTQHQCKAIIDEARRGLKAELVDMAVSNALAKLPKVITTKDQEHLFENFHKNAFKPPQTA